MRKIDSTGSAEKKYSGRQKTHGTHQQQNTNAAEELLLNQEDAPPPEIHRTVRHFEHNNDTTVNRDFPIVRERERILFATALQAYQKGYKPI